jgi:hypothetical protein
MAATNEAPNARTRLLEEVATQMDAIEGDFGEDFEIEAAVTVVAVKGSGRSELRVRHINASPVEAIGLLYLGQDNLKESISGS